VEDVLGEFLTQFGSDFVVGLSVMTVSGSEALQVPAPNLARMEAPI
jgi:hypothetical protein